MGSIPISEFKGLNSARQADAFATEHTVKRKGLCIRSESSQVVQHVRASVPVRASQPWRAK